MGLIWSAFSSDPRMDLEKTFKVLGDVSGHQVSYRDERELPLDKSEKLRFEADFIFGTRYDIHLWQELEPRCGILGVSDAGYKLKNEHGQTILSKGFSSTESIDLDGLSTEKFDSALKGFRSEFLINQFGGISTDIPFMDYESYTSGSISEHNESSYFANIYLGIMCDLKNRGIPLPPIISKQDDIRDLMESGEIETLEEVLSNILSRGEADYGAHCLSHMAIEKEKILEYALQTRNYHDLSIPIEKKIKHANFLVVPGENPRPYNLLVVEDFGNHLYDFGTIDCLSRDVCSQLEKFSRFHGSKIFSTVRLSDCIEYVGTGQINAVLMDGGFDHLNLAGNLSRESGIGISCNDDNFESRLSNDCWEDPGVREKKIWRDAMISRSKQNGHKSPVFAVIPRKMIHEVKFGALLNKIL